MNGDVTTLVLTSLISQTEYDVAVTPVYDEGPGNPMLGSAITGGQILMGRHGNPALRNSRARHQISLSSQNIGQIPGVKMSVNAAGRAPVWNVLCIN